MKETLKKQRLFFISIIGIVVVSLVMGTTFAYQTISMNETETRKVVLEAGVLDVSFKTTNLIETSNMPLLPAYTYADYTEFTVDNTKSSADAAFKIGLADIEYGYINDSGTKTSGCRTATSTVQAACIVDENFKYTVVEVVDEEETLVKEGNFANLASTEADLTNFITITKGTTKTYRLYLWLNETEDNQNHLEKTYFKGKINIKSVFSEEASNPYADKSSSLAYHIINNTKNLTNEEISMGYAVYRSTPLTIPNKEVTGKYYGAASSELNVGTSDNPSFFVISDDYRIHDYGYGIYFDNAQVVQYTGDLNNVLIYENGVSTGQTTSMVGKYMKDSRYYTMEEGTYAFPTLSSATTAAKESAKYAIDQFWIIGSETTSTELYYREIFLESESIESTLSIIPDDYTIYTGINSYYFRGGVTNNYVEFGGKCWRIVRIEGDGSVKITLAKNGLCSTISDTDTTSAFIGTGHFGYDSKKFPNYDDSTYGSMKSVLNSWFSSFSTELKNKVRASEICLGDLSTFYSYDWSIITEMPDLEYVYYYNGLKAITGEYVSLVCGSNANKTSSSKVFSLMIEEIILAGDKYDVFNKSSYLTENAQDSWWSITPLDYDPAFSAADAFIKRKNDILESYVDKTNYIRPAISLVADVEIESGGIGTIDKPYIIKMN